MGKGNVLKVVNAEGRRTELPAGLRMQLDEVSFPGNVLGTQIPIAWETRMQTNGRFEIRIRYPRDRELVFEISAYDMRYYASLLQQVEAPAVAK
jgi:hypothetical protein